MYLLRDYIAARAQLVTFILFVLTIYCIESFLKSKKKRYCFGLVLIPIIIANVHVAVFPFYFVLYLPYIVEYMVYILSNTKIIIVTSKIKSLHKKIGRAEDEKKVKEIKDKIKKLEEKEDKLIKEKERVNENPYKIILTRNDNVRVLIIVMIICLFTGLLTPLGNTPYTYLIKTMKGNTTQNISEHLPLVLANDIYYAFELLIFILILTFTDTKIKLRDLFMLAGLTFLTFKSRRQESMFIIICAFILNRLVCSMFNKYDPEGCKKLIKRMTGILGMIITINLVLIISIINYKPKMKDKFVDESSYPVMAADYILNNLDIENIKLYNEYNYGSYLLFRGIPVFIDSRADLYSPEFNEGVDIFNDYLNLAGLSIDNVEEVLDKYGITHLIMYKDAKLRTFIKQDKEKYEQLYEDDHFCIYERKQV